MLVTAWTSHSYYGNNYTRAQRAESPCLNGLCVFWNYKFLCYVYSPISAKRKYVLKNKLNIPYSKKVSRRKNLNYLLMSKTPWCITLNFKLLIQRCFSLMYNLRMHFNLLLRALRNLKSIAWKHSKYKIKRLDIQLLGMLLSNTSKQ